MLKIESLNVDTLAVVWYVCYGSTRFLSLSKGRNIGSFFWSFCDGGTDRGPFTARMGDSVLEAAIEGEVNPLMDGRGFSLVELQVNRSHRNVHISIIVYRPEGVGINDLSELSRSLKPRIELLEGLENFTLVVSSPGIDRVIKHNREYAIFKGKGIRLLLENGSDWIGGVVEDADEDYLHLMTSQGSRKIVMEDIRKAKLDYEEEVRKTGNVL